MMRARKEIIQSKSRGKVVNCHANGTKGTEHIPPEEGGGRAAVVDPGFRQGSQSLKSAIKEGLPVLRF